MALTIEQRVANGIQYLKDTHKGGMLWLELIDIEQLDMSSSTWCIIGQVFGEYWRWSTTARVTAVEQRRLGFEANYFEDEYGDGRLDYEDYAALQAEWVRVLTELKGS